MKRAASPLPEMLLAAAAAAAGIGLTLWVYARFSLPLAPAADVMARVTLPQLPLPTGEREYVAERPRSLWPANEPSPWHVVYKEETVLPPADLEPPVPLVPLPPTPMPQPGPRFEFSSGLPRWGAYPGAEAAR